MHPRDGGEPDGGSGRDGAIPEDLVDDQSSASIARRDYDPQALFRSREDGGSVTAAASATDAEVEWLTPPHRYGHFSGRPLDPDEIAADYRRERRRRLARLAALAAALATGIGLFVWNLNNDPWLPLAATEPGTCFQDSLSSLVVRDEVRYRVRTTVEVVDCEQPHQYESLGTVEMTGFGDTTTMAATADRLCAPMFEGYVGAGPGEAGPWQLATFPPYLMFVAGEQAHCLAYQGGHSGATDDPYQPTMAVGTARDAAGP